MTRPLYPWPQRSPDIPIQPLSPLSVRSNIHIIRCHIHWHHIFNVTSKYISFNSEIYVHIQFSQRRSPSVIYRKHICFVPLNFYPWIELNYTSYYFFYLTIKGILKPSHIQKLAAGDSWSDSSSLHFTPSHHSMNNPNEQMSPKNHLILHSTKITDVLKKFWLLT